MQGKETELAASLEELKVSIDTYGEDLSKAIAGDAIGEAAQEQAKEDYAKAFWYCATVNSIGFIMDVWIELQLKYCANLRTTFTWQTRKVFRVRGKALGQAGSACCSLRALLQVKKRLHRHSL